MISSEHMLDNAACASQDRRLADDEDYREIIHLHCIAPLQAEVERLEKALRLACGELSTYGNHTGQHPQDVYDNIYKEARDG